MSKGEIFLGLVEGVVQGAKKNIDLGDVKKFADDKKEVEDLGSQEREGFKKKQHLQNEELKAKKKESQKLLLKKNNREFSNNRPDTSHSSVMLIDNYTNVLQNQNILQNQNPAHQVVQRSQKEKIRKLRANLSTFASTGQTIMNEVALEGARRALQNHIAVVPRDGVNNYNIRANAQRRDDPGRG